MACSNDRCPNEELNGSSLCEECWGWFGGYLGIQGLVEALVPEPVPDEIVEALHQWKH